MSDFLLFKSLAYFYEIYKNNINRIFSIAVENMHQQTLRTSFGLWWVFFRDFVYLTSFTIFRYLMSGSGEIDGMNFILYLMVALIPWNFMNECINGGISAIKSNKNILSSIQFPVGILPTIEILAIFMKRLFTLIILFVVISIFGDIRDVTLWMFIYYFIMMFIFMCIWNFVFSAIVAISNDFEQFYRALTSVLFFTMPIMWSFEIIQQYPWLIRFFKLNPFVYLIEGFRDACSTGTLPDLEYTIYFLSVNLILLFIGCILQYKLKNHYIDLI